LKSGDANGGGGGAFGVFLGLALNLRIFCAQLLSEGLKCSHAFPPLFLSLYISAPLAICGYSLSGGTTNFKPTHKPNTINIYMIFKRYPLRLRFESKTF